MQRWLAPFVPRPEHRPLGRAQGPSLSLRWLGTAGHALSTERTTILLDPFLTRPGPGALLRPLRTDESLFEAWLPPRVDAVLLGHSHYDHLLDAPAIARRYGCLFVGSRSAVHFARAAGVPEAQLRMVPPQGARLTVGDFEARFVPSLHGRFAAGRVPFDGEVLEAPSLPAPAWGYRMGGAFGIHLTAGELTVYHNGSADLVDAALEGLRAKLLLVGLAGRFATRDYLARLTGLLRPEVLVPTHHDAFFGPLALGEKLLPTVDLPGFFSEARVRCPEARIVTPLYRDDLALPLEGDARALVVQER